MYTVHLLLVLILLSSCKSEQTAVSPTEEIVQANISTPMIKAPQEDITLDYCMGKFEPSGDKRFTIVEKRYADREGMYLRKEAYEAFKEMHAAAGLAGVRLTIRSATRNFDYQKGIWERKWTGKTILSDGVNAQDITEEKSRALKIMNYSAMPGASRHHWGTDIDMNSFNNSYFESGEGLKVYTWLIAHAHEYGYCQPYTPKKTGRSGYNEEKWHWSYTPLSKPLTAFAAMHLHDHHFADFNGYKSADKIGVVDKYVLGIDKSCK